MTAESSTQKRLGTALFYGIIAVLAYLAFLVFAPFLAALSWAVILVVLFHPLYMRLAGRLGPTMAAAASTIGVTLVLIVPMVLVMIAFVRQGVSAAQSLQEGIAGGRFSWVSHLWSQIQQRIPETNLPDLATTLHRYAEEAAKYSATQLGTVLRNTAAFLFHLGVTILAMFYLFRDGSAIVERLREVLPFEEEYRSRMLSEARDLIFASVISSLVAAAAHGVLGCLAFGLTGIRAPIFWGVMMGFFSLVPVVGSALIWVPASVSLALGGHWERGIFLAIICGVIVGLVDNLIRPWLISGRAEMSGLMVFISVLGGISVFGMLGIVLGPIVVAVAGSMLDLYVPGAHGGNKASEASGR